jgi:small GTP-binding protein
MICQTDEDAVVIKVIVLGSANVGKTALIQQFCYNKFSEDSIPTIENNSHTKLMDIEGNRIALQLWDTAVRDI